MAKEIKRVEAHGDDWYMAGKRAGEQLQQETKGVYDLYRDYFGNDYFARRALALGYVGLSQSAYPEVVQMVHGFSQGSRIDFADVWGLMVEEMWDRDVSDEQKGGGCTDVVFMPELTGSGMYLGHTNDTWGEEDWVVATEVDVPGCTKTLVVGMGLVVGAAINVNGMYLGGNNLVAKKVKNKGIARDVMSLVVAKQPSIEEAKRMIYGPGQASRYNNILAQYNKSGEAMCVSIEGDAEQVRELFPEGGLLTHANNFKHADNLVLENSRELSLSSSRDEQATRLGTNVATPDLMETWKILANHGSLQSICRHRQEGESGRFETHTVFASVVSLNSEEGRIYAARGNPCIGTPELLWTTTHGFKN